MNAGGCVLFPTGTGSEEDDDDDGDDKEGESLFATSSSSTCLLITSSLTSSVEPFLDWKGGKSADASELNMENRSRADGDDAFPSWVRTGDI